jgi:hypothetical protein
MVGRKLDELTQLTVFNNPFPSGTVPCNGLLLSTPGATPSGLPDKYSVVDMLEIYHAGCFHVYRVVHLYVTALLGDTQIFSGGTCGSLNETGTQVAVYPYQGFVLGVPPATTYNCPYWATLPLTVFPTGAFDPCEISAVGLSYDIPVLYVGTYMPMLPPGTDRAATPEFACSLVDTGGAIDDQLGATLAWTAATLPDWVLYGGIAPDVTRGFWAQGRRVTP